MHAMEAGVVIGNLFGTAVEKTFYCLCFISFGLWGFRGEFLRVGTRFSVERLSLPILVLKNGLGQHRNIGQHRMANQPIHSVEALNQ